MLVLGGASAAQASPGIGGAESNGDVSISACKSAGGGNWCYGTSVGSGGLMRCYSNYIHNKNYHSSTAIAASSTSKRYASAGYESRAAVTVGWAYTCHTYYNPDA